MLLYLIVAFVGCLIGYIAGVAMAAAAFQDELEIRAARRKRYGGGAT